MTLSLDDYRAPVALDSPFEAPAPAATHEAPGLAAALLEELLASTLRDGPVRRIAEAAELSARQRLHALLSVRPARPYLIASFHERLDRLLRFEREQRPTVRGTALPAVSKVFAGNAYPAAAQCALWQGDITSLEVDAIVNAANDALLGCFQPFHACIDNAIHAAAGPRLREDCDRIMTLQGSPERTGRAKITRGYHLPARFVLHTVGPIYRGTAPVPTLDDREALADCYRACLDLSAQVGSIRSIAFCCISTGVFGFPPRPAAEVALRTVERWLRDHPGALDRVVFNVFSEADSALYGSLLAR